MRALRLASFPALGSRRSRDGAVTPSGVRQPGATTAASPLLSMRRALAGYWSRRLEPIGSENHRLACDETKLGLEPAARQLLGVGLRFQFAVMGVHDECVGRELVADRERRGGRSRGVEPGSLGKCCGLPNRDEYRNPGNEQTGVRLWLRWMSADPARRRPGR